MHHRSHDQHPGGGGLPMGGGRSLSAYGGRGWADPPIGTRKAGSTHPTGMLSCFWDNFTSWDEKLKRAQKNAQIFGASKPGVSGAWVSGTSGSATGVHLFVKRWKVISRGEITSETNRSTGSRLQRVRLQRAPVYNEKLIFFRSLCAMLKDDWMPRGNEI